MADDIAYQNAGAVRQLLAERENAVAYGQDTRVEAIDKQLKVFGVNPKHTKKTEEKLEEAENPPEPEKVSDEPPLHRSTKQEHQHKA